MLSDIVTILIGDQHGSTLVKLLQDRGLILIGAEFKHALNDTASIWMCGKSMDLSLEGLNDELNVLGWNSLDGLLNYVVAILVLDAFQDIWLEFSHKLSLLVGKNVLQGLHTIINTKCIQIVRLKYSLSARHGSHTSAMTVH